MTRTPHPSKAAAVGALVAAIVSSAAETAADETALQEAEHAEETDRARGIDAGIQTWVSDGWN